MNNSKRRLAPRTCKRRLTSIREFSEFHGIPKILPKFKLPSPGEPIPHPLPGLRADLENMLANCKADKQRCLIALLGLEGLRLEEARNLKIDNLDIDEMTISVFGKGAKVRVIPITELAWPYIYPQIIDRRISGAAGTDVLVPYSDRGARNFITELGVRAGVSIPVASHDLRMTFATLAYGNGMDILAVQGWLGHADVNQTQGYIKSGMSRMRKAGEF